MYVGPSPTCFIIVCEQLKTPKVVMKWHFTWQNFSTNPEISIYINSLISNFQYDFNSLFSAEEHKSKLC